MFSIWLCSFQGTERSDPVLFRFPLSGLLRSLKTIQAKEDVQSFDQLSLDFSALRLSLFRAPQIRSIPLALLYRPGMNDPVPLLVLSLERR